MRVAFVIIFVLAALWWVRQMCWCAAEPDDPQENNSNLKAREK